MDTFAQRHARTGPNAQEASPAGAAAEANDYSFECEDGPNVTWQVLQMELVEALFEPYALTVELTTDDVDAELDDMLGASCRLWIERGEQQRCVPGIVHRLDTSETDGRLLHVRAFVRPALWLLTQRIDSRTWQHLSAPEILREVLTAPLAQHGREIVFDLRGTYSEREYCVQYRESDYGFACRLMEEEGISFYFDREDDNERLVLTDTNDLYPSVPTEPNAPDFVVPWVDNPDQAAGSQAVWSLHSSQELTSTSVVRRDFDWRTPGDRSVSESRATDHRGFDREVFDPGQQHTSARGGEQLVARQREALAVQRRRFRGQGNIVGFSPGHVFELPDHPHASSDPRYLLTRVVHESGTTDAAGADRPAQPDLEYGSSFECIPLDVPFRPLPRHTRPRIHGPQTAMVTGPEGDQIHTEEHGRIRVLMRWDRDAPA
ncbi:MAG: type VI secretion system tip protein VgrG, partial [Deltaproteobacteria bacterium]|nr:type VI secretion system tip protein VgrG [Deltaproteobacteria bacterium]